MGKWENGEEGPSTTFAALITLRDRGNEEMGKWGNGKMGKWENVLSPSPLERGWGEAKLWRGVGVRQNLRSRRL